MINTDNQNLRIAIAEKLGYRKCKSCLENGYLNQWRKLDDSGCVHADQLPDYLDDPAAALLLVEHMATNGQFATIGKCSNAYEVTIETKDGEIAYAEAETFPLAVARAFALAQGINPQP